MANENYYSIHLEMDGLDRPEVDYLPNAIDQLKRWVDDAVRDNGDPTLMTLATSTFEGKPSVRTMFLRRLDERGLLFFTNYESKKGKQLLQNPYASACFYWPSRGREVRIDGYVHRAADGESDEYFSKCEESVQVSLWAFPQSQVVQSRKYLETLCSDFREEVAGKKIPRPSNWGGYILEPQQVDFLQLRSNGIHDRLQYTLFNGDWQLDRLSP